MMHWPAWIPYPQSWLRAFGLTLWLSLVGRITQFWTGGLGIVALVVSGRPGLLIFLGFLGLLLPFVLLAYGHHLLWGKAVNRTHWLPGMPSFKEGAYALIVVLGATTAAAALILPFVNWQALANRNPSYYDDWMALAYSFGAIWLISAAYVYHARHLLRRRRRSLSLLAEAYKNGWQLTTPHLVKLLNLSSEAIVKQKSLERRGFKFTKAGCSNNQITWKLEKLK
jgi:hypothetical protein